jgi:hypothetical protein
VELAYAGTVGEKLAESVTRGVSIAQASQVSPYHTPAPLWVPITTEAFAADEESEQLWNPLRVTTGLQLCITIVVVATVRISYEDSAFNLSEAQPKSDSRQYVVQKVSAHLEAGDRCQSDLCSARDREDDQLIGR